MISGEAIRLLRLLKGIKQETLAKKLGISQPAYCKLEHCEKINVIKYYKIIEVLNCTDEEMRQVMKISSTKKVP